MWQGHWRNSCSNSSCCYGLIIITMSIIIVVIVVIIIIISSSSSSSSSCDISCSCVIICIIRCSNSRFRTFVLCLRITWLFHLAWYSIKLGLWLTANALSLPSHGLRGFHQTPDTFQSCISKGIWRQGKGSSWRNSYVSTLCSYLCTSDTLPWGADGCGVYYVLCYLIFILY